MVCCYLQPRHANHRFVSTAHRNGSGRGHWSLVPACPRIAARMGLAGMEFDDVAVAELIAVCDAQRCTVSWPAHSILELPPKLMVDGISQVLDGRTPPQDEWSIQLGWLARWFGVDTDHV